MSRAADLIVGGWEINGFYTFQSGQPFTVTCPECDARPISVAQPMWCRAGSLHRPAQLHAMVEPRCVCTATRGYHHRADLIIPRLAAASSRYADRISPIWIRRS